MMELEGKVALVSGGAVRVGRAIALALAEAGCHLFIHYGNSDQAAVETQAAAQALGVKAVIHQANLAEAEAAAEIMPAAIERFGQVDILVNNAAIFKPGVMAETDLAMWEEHFAVNLRAPFLLSQAFAGQIPPDGQGQIINVSDARVFRPAPDHFAYRLTKTALTSMTQLLALELAPRIRVNAVALGAILPPPEEDESYLEQLAQNRVPLRRPGHPRLVAQNVLHLLRQEFLTGVVIPIDGGEFL